MSRLSASTSFNQVECAVRYRARWAAALVIVLAMTSASNPLAMADVKSAVKGKDKSSIEVTNKTQPATGVFIWVETKPGSGMYEFTGTRVNTDANGNGSANPTNSSMPDEWSKGNNVKTGGRPVTAGGSGVDATNVGKPVAQVAPVNGSWVAGLNAIPSVLMAQAVSDGVTTLRETWDAGTLYEINLRPDQASWVNQGASVQTTGDLSAELVEVTSSHVIVRVLGDPTSTTDDDLLILGLGVNVLPNVQQVNLQLGYLGSYSAYVNGEFIGTETSTDYVYNSWYAVPAPEPGAITLLAAPSIQAFMLRKRERTFVAPRRIQSKQGVGKPVRRKCPG